MATNCSATSKTIAILEHWTLPEVSLLPLPNPYFTPGLDCHMPTRSGAVNLYIQYFFLIKQ